MGKLVYTSVQLMLGIILLIMYPLIENQLSHNLDLTPLKLCLNDNNVAPHLVVTYLMPLFGI